MYEEQIQTITAQVAEALAEQGLPFAPDRRAALELLSAPGWAEELAQLTAQLPHVRLRGLMAIPPVSLEIGSNRPYFQAMRQLFVDIKGKMAHNQDDMDCLSMGMSGDYADAIAEGSTLVRVGTALFGPRPPMTRQ